MGVIHSAAITSPTAVQRNVAWNGSSLWVPGDEGGDSCCGASLIVGSSRG